MKVSHIFLPFLLILLLGSCSSKEADTEKRLLQIDASTSAQLSLLRSHIENNRVKNATLLAHYAKLTKIRSPEYTEIADALALDSTIKGPIFESLQARYDAAHEQLQSLKSQTLESSQALLSEYESIYSGSTLDNYNLMLTDPINVLADLSENKLPRIEADPKEKSLSENSAKDLGAGSQLVGNPNYGQWQQQSNGTSFWAFYGQYALLSRLFDRPYSYGYWSQNRDYSYYHDVGRRYYSSPKQTSQQTAVETRARKNFQSQGKSFNSPYAKARTSGSNAKSVVSSPSKFKSSNSGSESKFASKYGNSSSQKPATSSQSKSSFFSRSGSKSRTFRSGGK